MTMTPERLAELDAVMAKATDNEWVADKNGYGVNFISGGAHHVSKVGTPYRDPIAGGNNHDTLRENDAAAIVALHNAYPDLRANIDALAATIARLRGALDSERSRANADVLGCVNPLEMDDLLARLKRIEATLTGAQ